MKSNHSTKIRPQQTAAQPRFFDNRDCLCVYSDPILILCPICQKPGSLELRKVDRDKRRWQAQRFFGCHTCGHSFVWKPPLVIHSVRDWDKVLPLLLQTKCCSKNLWAFNAAHLEFIERYSQAFIRERTSSSNASLASRLPQWIKAAKNRDSILKAMKKLKRTLANRKDLTNKRF